MLVLTTIFQDDPEVTIGNDKFEVDSFCYLSDSISHSGSCLEAMTDRVRVACMNFHRLLPVLTNSGILLKVRGHAYNACIHSVLLYTSETWAVKVDDDHRLRNNNAIVRRVCSANYVKNTYV